MPGVVCILVSLFLLSAFHHAHATQSMRKPNRSNSTPPTVATKPHPETHVVQRAADKTQVAYFTNWEPTDIIPSTLSHILYAFADVSPDTGAISLTDPYADEQKHFPMDSWSDTGNNLYGCLKQMYLLKLANRNLKVLLSIGGWTYSQAGHFDFVTDPPNRATFVAQAVSLIENFGFDGMQATLTFDLDYEYPMNTEQGQGFSDLITELRTAFDNLAAQKGDSVPYQLTAAVSANASDYQWLNIPQIDQALTYWNLMSYDYAGSWLTWADNQANLFDGQRTGINTDMAVNGYVAAGASINKINMGIPIYGRAFENTANIGSPYNGIGPGTYEAGVYQYKVLPILGASVFENTTDVTSYSYNPITEELVSYDTPNIVKLKARYINDNGLAGAMYWDLIRQSSHLCTYGFVSKNPQDTAGVSTSLVQNVLTQFSSLDQTLNHINFPNSVWTNIANNMGGSSTTTSIGASPTGTGACGSVAAWSSTIVYDGGSEVEYNGELWEAQWWTQNDTPDGKTGVWVLVGPC
ncbi:glycosyl hydrolases family 18-domain-containing protein [Rhodocollybia butyracea]|uniref:Glycosyl hydrolases family 18-domain-containing protein n=1 Tax=Rhodocollybia butyracea TaxID=206335 RepID=A0A9P5PQC8_9AGAR|nr:glycosyl hydrolases family 18-domain-containing protein [Rhodocollybia butyracea]